MSIHRDKQSGSFVFEFSRRINGQRVRARKRLPKTWNQAQADAYDRQESARLYALATRTGGVTHLIEDAVAVYIKHRTPSLKSGENIARELGEVFWAYQGRPISALPDVAKTLQIKNTVKLPDGIEKTLKPATIKNRISYLRAACRFAWKFYDMGDSDPGAKVTVPIVNNARQNYISREQMIMAARACENRPTRAVIRIAFYSGMRLGEIERARIEGDLWALDETKNSSPRRVPIHGKVKVIAGKYELPSRYTISYHWRKTREKVGLNHITIHDLRHSAASAMINEDVDLYTVGAVLGHKSAASTKRYAHLSTGALTDAVSKIGKKRNVQKITHTHLQKVG